jgi:hypothetical protein
VVSLQMEAVQEQVHAHMEAMAAAYKQEIQAIQAQLATPSVGLVGPRPVSITVPRCATVALLHGLCQLSSAPCTRGNLPLCVCRGQLSRFLASCQSVLLNARPCSAKEHAV